MPTKVTNINSNNKIITYRYEGGTKESKIQYVDGKAQGMALGWREDGTKWWEIRRSESAQHGISTGWDDSGMKWWEEMWVNDKKHGMNTWWWDNGEIQAEIYYIAGKEYARIEWNEEGRVTKLELPARATTTKPKTNTLISTPDKSRK